MTGTVLPPAPVDWLAANQASLAAALARLRHRLLGQEPPTPEPDPDRTVLTAVATGFELSPFERDILLMCAGMELDSGFAEACGVPTFGLALARLPEAHWSALSPAGGLRRWYLVELVQPATPTTSPLRIDERVLHALAGVSYLDPRVAQLADPGDPLAGEDVALPPALARAAEAVRAAWSRPARRTVLLHGRPRLDLRLVATAAARGLGLEPICLPAADLPANPAERELLARLCERETVLTGAAWLIEVDDAAADAGRAGQDLARRIAAPVVLTARDPLPGITPLVTAIRVATSPPADRARLWRERLGPDADRLDGWVGRIAAQFDLELAAVDAAASAASQTAGWLADPHRPQDRIGDRIGAQLWAACREQARPALADLAQLTEPGAGWDDLVLPASQARTLREIVAHVRHRPTVVEDWGFGAGTGRGLGVAVLFAGPSGTGKTLAAEVLAGALALDLYRVDLSQVVSKYIGETEKNLRRIFDAAEAGGVVLLFDEADALFGKRSEVKDSHDRYANIEVSYLLQRMENYRGLAILTTNQKSALDPAFLRRLRFIVQFPFPDAAGRAAIWRRTFPAAAPTDGLDPARLAQLTVPGGAIRNIGLSAAFLAADAGEPVRMRHVLQAARTEYAKMERPLTDAEVARWPK